MFIGATGEREDTTCVRFRCFGGSGVFGESDLISIFEQLGFEVRIEKGFGDSGVFGESILENLKKALSVQAFEGRTEKGKTIVV